MYFDLLDWSIIGGYSILALGLGVWLSRRASGSSEDYFLAGRSLPWWVAGISMVATTFAADTPLGITKLVADHGIAGNWFWWSLAFSHVLAAFVFSRLWRRSGVITDASLIAIRYSGREAAVLQGSKAFIYAVVLNCITMGWVILAMAKIMRIFFDWSRLLPPPLWNGLVAIWPDGMRIDPSAGFSILLCAAIALGYASLAGMWGVAVTDLVQFVLAMVGSIALAWYAVKHVGGLESLRHRLDDLYGADSGIQEIVPTADSGLLSPLTLFVYVGVIWWAQKYSDGSGYLMQRMAASKNEREALKGTLLFAVAHYALRPWPWILVAMAALVIFPVGAHPGLDRELTYPMLMADLLPHGLLGLAVTAMLAAFMSTLDTHLNWGASYIVEDIYRRFVNPEATPKQQIRVARASGVVLVVLGGLVATVMDSVAGAWMLLVLLMGGIGSVNIARWIWWRVSAWSELVALASSLLTAAVVSNIPGMEYGEKILWVVSISSTAWVSATFLLPGTDHEVLRSFYQKVRPPGAWGRVARGCDRQRLPDDLGGGRVVAAWMLGMVLVYGLNFGIGQMLLGRPALGILLVMAGIVSGWWALELSRPAASPGSMAQET